MLNKFYLYISLFSVVVFSSCSNYRYVHRDIDATNKIVEIYSLDNYEPYQLQPFDYLYVNIRSTDEQINEFYSRISSNYSSSMSNNQSNFFLSGYLVNDSGYVFIPTLGMLNVGGLTIDQTRKLINDKVDEILTDAVVNVRLTSFNVTFLGEINNGNIPFYRERVNVLEAIGQAGGVPNSGDKKHVKIIRPQDSIMVVYEIDLTDKNIIATKDFFLQPNDIVYVPPKRQQEFWNFFRDYSTFLSIITTTLTTTLIILELNKN
ncbi:MAG: polysaccharide biosynthesis/export family protein [Bacteroidales bacterium]|nr:polysaccharide biosynthesis/export family protein [Bacteroidales bacterium]